MKSFLIGGTIIDDSSQAWSFEDVTPSQVRAFLAKCEPKEEVTFEVSSPGGSVTAGIAIANFIREASKRGTPCRCHVVGIAASMASVIACACDEIDIDEGAFMMIHNPWTMTEGDAEDLRKSADLLDQMKQATISFYRSKFNKTDEEIAALMDDETWFTGAQAADFGFKCNVVPAAAALKVAACARHLPAFGKIPQVAEHLFAVAKPLDKPLDKQSATTPEPPQSEGTGAQPTAADGSEPADANTPPPAAEPKPAPTDPMADTEAAFTARLAAAMRSRDNEINDLKAQLADFQKRSAELVANCEASFKAQLAAKDKELTDVRAEVTRLTEAVKSANDELQVTASALNDANNALATLNANVNTPSATQRTVKARTYMASLFGAERVAFYREHREAVDANATITL